MTITLELDDDLLHDVVNLGGFQTKQIAVTQVLLEFVKRRKQAEIIKLFGTIEYDQDHDYKNFR